MEPDEIEEICVAWIGSMLHDEESQSVQLFYRNVLSPFLKEQGQEGAAALCENLALMASDLIQRLCVETDKTELEILSWLLEPKEIVDEG